MPQPPHFDPTPGPDATVVERDSTLEAAVMRLLLVEHPAQLTAAELTRELGELGDAPGAVDDAVRRLVGVGLAHRHGEFIVPSRAALYFDRLPID